MKKGKENRMNSKGLLTSAFRVTAVEFKSSFNIQGSEMCTDL
jgi:hypothetical protein